MPTIRLAPRVFAFPALLAVAAAVAPASAAPPSAADALALKPRQKGIEVAQPTEAEVKQATINQEKEGGVMALVVRGPSGEVLRAFADSDGNRVVDRWSYYKDGMEIYRELDSDKDTKADEYRWLGGAGSRWGADTNADGVIDAWKVLSAEEATAEVVNAIRDRDAAAFARLLPTKADLEAAGFEGELLTELVTRITAAPAAFGRRAERHRGRRPLDKHAHTAGPGHAARGNVGPDKGRVCLRQRRGARGE